MFLELIVVIIGNIDVIVVILIIFVNVYRIRSGMRSFLASIRAVTSSWLGFRLVVLVQRNVTFGVIR